MCVRVCVVISVLCRLRKSEYHNIHMYTQQGFIQRGGKLGFPPPQDFEKILLLYIEKSVQIVNDDKCELFMTGTKFTD